jgi:hypothetical protein
MRATPSVRRRTAGFACSPPTAGTPCRLPTICSLRPSWPPGRTRSSWPTSVISRPTRAGCISPSSSILLCVEPTLHRRIVPAIARAAHRRNDPIGFQHRTVVAGGILASAVGVVDQSAAGPLPLEGHGWRGDRQFLAEVVAHRPSHHLAAEQTELVHHTGNASRDEARLDLFAYIETYDNRQRLHSALGYRTPEQAKLHAA